MPGLDIHAGIWLALSEMGIYATEISGTSAGAIAGAANAAGWGAKSFASHLREYSDDYLRHERPLWKLRLPWIESIQDNDRIRCALEGMLPASFGQFIKPFHAWACRRRTGDCVNVARPELAATPSDAVLASMSICGMFPAVGLLDGEDYIDGGVRFNLPLLANWRDYDAVYLLIAKPRAQDYQGRGVISNLVRNLNLLMLDQIVDVLDQTRGAPNVHVVWPEIPGSGSMLRFDHDLIDVSRAAALRQLQTMKREQP